MLKNISNHDIFEKDCTRCNTCHYPSWYVMECSKCGDIICDRCHGELDEESELLTITCNCGESILYYD